MGIENASIFRIVFNFSITFFHYITFPFVSHDKTKETVILQCLTHVEHFPKYNYVV